MQEPNIRDFLRRGSKTEIDVTHDTEKKSRTGLLRRLSQTEIKDTEAKSTQKLGLFKPLSTSAEPATVEGTAVSTSPKFKRGSQEEK
ncbi:MAG TPA: hypothetical protein VGV92_09635 [Gammaproteobacteria bacterium]|nr:hypothetical protein [Gammaproteobacteria bacterium]